MIVGTLLESSWVYFILGVNMATKNTISTESLTDILTNAPCSVNMVDLNRSQTENGIPVVRTYEHQPHKNLHNLADLKEILELRELISRAKMALHANPNMSAADLFNCCAEAFAVLEGSQYEWCKVGKRCSIKNKGVIVSILNIDVDRGCFCSDMQWHCRSELEPAMLGC